MLWQKSGGLGWSLLTGCFILPDLVDVGVGAHSTVCIVEQIRSGQSAGQRVINGCGTGQLWVEGQPGPRKGILAERTVSSGDEQLALWGGYALGFSP